MRPEGSFGYYLGRDPQQRLQCKKYILSFLRVKKEFLDNRHNIYDVGRLQILISYERCIFKYYHRPQ